MNQLLNRGLLLLAFAMPLGAHAECASSFVYENWKYMGCDVTLDGVTTRLDQLSEEGCKTYCYYRIPDGDEDGTVYYGHGAW